MTEEFLHYLWRTKQIDTRNLNSTQGEKIRIVDFGLYNYDAGPDFLEGRVMIDDQLWVGQIEFHIESSDWYKHQHEKDPAYQNVILHVVYNHNSDVFREDKSEISCLELKGKFDEHLYWRYEQLVQGQRFIPCENQLSVIDEFKKVEQYDKWLIERLKRKSAWLITLFNTTNGDWDEIMYRSLLFAFGLKINAQPFLSIANKLSLKVLGKHSSDLFQLEAMLFGVSGFLDDVQDDYTQKLKNEFSFLESKYDLSSVRKVEWKFSKLRPQGFPTVRLAQFAAMLSKNFPVFDTLIKEGNLDKLYEMLDIEVSDYWQSHVVFGKESSIGASKPGKDFINRLIINAVVPLHFAFAEIKKESFYKQRSMDILDQLPAEKNKITRKLEKLGFRNENGFESQALLEMYNNYCSDKKCLNCAIANRLLRL